jgi:inhibitor of KinA
MGEDLDAVASILQLDPQEIVDLHVSVEYRCVAIGFCPGFPYLGYLPSSLWGTTRRPEPRIRVPKRSVALTGKQTGIYPSETPGGWWLIGRTPLEIVNLEDGYFPISAGDRIQFYAINEQEYQALEGQRL